MGKLMRFVTYAHNIYITGQDYLEFELDGVGSRIRADSCAAYTTLPQNNLRRAIRQRKRLVLSVRSRDGSKPVCYLAYNGGI